MASSRPVFCGPFTSKKFVGYLDSTGTATYNNGAGRIKVKYRVSDAPTAKQEVYTSDKIILDLTQGYGETIVSGSVRFNLGNKAYIDRLGSLYHSINSSTGAGTFAGTIDYSSGRCEITDWTPGTSNSLVVESLLTTFQSSPVSQMVFRIPNAPIKSQSLQIRVVPVEGGGELTAVSAADGTITDTDIGGYIDYESGLVELNFGGKIVAAGNETEWWYDAAAVDGEGNIFKPRMVFADTMLYNATAQSFLPLDESILGLNPVRLPQDGRIPVYADGDVVVVLHDQITGGTFTNGTQTDLGRVRLSKVTVKDAAGNNIDSAKYSVDLDTGIIEWIDLSGVSQPISITDRIEDMSVLTDVQITGKLTLSQPLTHDFPQDETLVSNAVIFGDKFAHTTIPFDQQTWTNEWSDAVIGSTVIANYNNSQFPIAVDNASCIQERWAIIFDSSNTVDVIGENVGQILSGVSIASDIAPVNPNTGQAYFTIPLDGWGSGWSSGNVVRFNTNAANAPSWIIQSVGQGEETDSDYNFCVEVRGDIDTP